MVAVCLSVLSRTSPRGGGGGRAGAWDSQGDRFSLKGSEPAPPARTLFHVGPAHGDLPPHRRLELPITACLLKPRGQRLQKRPSLTFRRSGFEMFARPPRVFARTGPAPSLPDLCCLCFSFVLAAARPAPAVQTVPGPRVPVSGCRPGAGPLPSRRPPSLGDRPRGCRPAGAPVAPVPAGAGVGAGSGLGFPGLAMLQGPLKAAAGEPRGDVSGSHGTRG